jgi:glycolate oxidase iron-sulfur subunit
VQTHLADFVKKLPEFQEIDAILRSCVHCGFCTATCPTYQLLGDECDSPRGRIYLIKQVLEGQTPTVKTQLHLDRCLTCRACETVCPSAVHYGRLVDIGRNIVEMQVSRPMLSKWQRWLLKNILPFRQRFSILLWFGQTFRFLLPATLKRQVPAKYKVKNYPNHLHQRQMLLLEGCVQPALAPNIHWATMTVLDRLGIRLIVAPKSGCCGALHYHLADHEQGLEFMRRNIDAWYPYLEQGIEAIITNASGCGVMIKGYAEALKHDQNYAKKAEKVSALAKDLSEILIAEDLSRLALPAQKPKIAFHAPCTLQHGQKLSGRVENLLTYLGFCLTSISDSHLCCGSAGTYSLLQPELSQKLLFNKIRSLEQGEPDLIVTANIGCLTHLQSATTKSIKHWVELLVP